MFNFTAGNEDTRYTIQWNDDFDCYTAAIEMFDGSAWVMIYEDIEADTVEGCFEEVEAFLQEVDAAG